jgi:hypothetical protein
MSEEKPAEQSEEKAEATTSDITSVTSITSASQYTEITTIEPVKKRWLKLALISLGGAVFGLLGLAIFTVMTEGKEALLGPEKTEEISQGPPLSATEIIAQEMSGKIETISTVDVEALTQPPDVVLPTLAELESRDFDEAAKDFEVDDKKSKKGDKVASKKAKDGKPGRNLASVDKSPLQLKFDKAGSKISKNLDKGKVMSLLAKKLDNSCQPTLPPNTKSVRAEIKVSKTGSIANIKVSPSSAEPELAKCMRKKLGDAKALKPKNKDVAQITVQFKVK